MLNFLLGLLYISTDNIEGKILRYCKFRLQNKNSNYKITHKTTWWILLCVE